MRLPDPDDDTLLDPEAVAAWLHVEPGWVRQAMRDEHLPVMGFTTAGEPVVAAGEIRAWLRRPDPHADET